MSANAASGGVSLIWTVTIATVAVAVPFLLLAKKGKKSKSLPPLPPEGPAFMEFLQTCIKAPNQQASVKKYGDIFCAPSPLRGIMPNLVWINDPTVVKYLTVTCMNLYREPSTFTTRGDAFLNATQSTVGTGVTSLKGEEWRWRKTALLKTFHKSRLLSTERGILDKIVQQGRVLCEALGRNADQNQVVAVDVLTTEAAVGVVLFFLFGRDLEFDAEGLRQAAGDLMESLAFLLFNPFSNWFKHIPGTEAYRIERRAQKARDYTDDIVKDEIVRLLDEYEGKVPVHPDRKPGSVLATLIAEEERFRKGGVSSMIAEVRTFVQAGFETTAHSLAFAMGMMAERPDLSQSMASLGEKLLKGDYYNVSSVSKALEKADVVKNFFQEALRLYPLAPSLGGECLADIVIESRGAKYGLPKGTSVVFPNVTLQRQVPNPDEIDPSRWDVKTKAEEPFLHTFQNGAHSCPGKPLSLLEGHVFLLLAATQFEFSFGGENTNCVEYEDNLLLRPKNGMPLRVKRRQVTVP